MSLELTPKSLILVSSDQIILFLIVWELLVCFCRLSYVLHCGEVSVRPLRHRSRTGRGLQWQLTLWNFLPSPSYISGAQPLWSLVSSSLVLLLLFLPLTKAVLPQVLSLSGQTGQGRVLVVPNFFHLRTIEADMLWGTLSAAEILLHLWPDLCLATILSLSSLGSSFTLLILICSDMHFELSGFIYTHVCLS